VKTKRTLVILLLTVVVGTTTACILAVHDATHANERLRVLDARCSAVSNGLHLDAQELRPDASQFRREAALVRTQLDLARAEMCVDHDVGLSRLEACALARESACLQSLIEAARREIGNRSSLSDSEPPL
jgi:hypothetical protein